MSYLERVRALNPLVHNITNLVVALYGKWSACPRSLSVHGLCPRGGR